jgi:hypothetical protein
MPGSARRFPGEYAGPAAGFAAGRELDTAPGCAVLALFAEDAAGPGDRYAGASEDELIGAICAWDRVEASAAAVCALAEVHSQVPGLLGRPGLGRVASHAQDMDGPGLDLHHEQDIQALQQHSVHVQKVTCQDAGRLSGQELPLFLTRRRCQARRVPGVTIRRNRR